MFLECIKAQRNLQYLGCGNCLEKLAEMFLSIFIGISFSIYDAVKSYCEKLVLKTKQQQFNSYGYLDMLSY